MATVHLNRTGKPSIERNVGTRATLRPQGLPGPEGPPGPAGGSDAATAEWVETGPLTTAALSATYVSHDGAAMIDLNRPGSAVVGDGIADDAAAINTEIVAAAAFGARVFARGTFRIDSQVTISSNADLGDATFNYHGTGRAVQVGDGAVLFRRIITLPHIVYANKPAVGWTAGTEGLRILNANGCHITIPRVAGFETGHRVHGEGQGNVHNTFFIGHLENNKRNEVLSADATGWSNSNLYVGGRFSHESDEGIAIAGSRHILLETAPNVVNGNTWLNPSIEGVQAEQMIDVDSGQYNVWLNPRLEASSGGKVRWGAGAVLNRIIAGYAASAAVVTRVTGESRNTIQAGNLFELYGSSAIGILRLQNSSSSTAPVIDVLEPGNLTDYAWRVTADAITGKRPAEAHPRFQLDRVNGRMYLGTGAAALAMYLRAVSTSGIALDNANLYFGTDNTFDIGLAGSLRPRYVRVGTAIQTGAFATGSRPSAATAGAGASVFDSTLGKPIWSTGAAWVDATGTAV